MLVTTSLVSPKMKKNAFTLIELLIAVSLIGLLFTIGIAYYQNFSRQQIIVQTAKEFKNNLRHAQSKALAGEKDESVCGSGLTATPLEGWFVEIAADSYEIYGRCGGVGNKFGSKTVQLPSTVTLEAFNESGTNVPSFYFQPLSRGVSRDLVDFKISGYGKTYELTLTQAGEIQDAGFPAAPTPTPSPTPVPSPTPTPSPTPVAPSPTPTPTCVPWGGPCTSDECCSPCYCHPSGRCRGGC